MDNNMVLVLIVVFALSIILELRHPQGIIPKNINKKYDTFKGVILQPVGCYGSLLSNNYSAPPRVINTIPELIKFQREAALHNPVFLKVKISSWDDIRLDTIAQMAFLTGWNYLGVAKGRESDPSKSTLILMKGLPILGNKELVVPCFSKYWTHEQKGYHELDSDDLKSKKEHKILNWEDSVKDKVGAYPKHGCGHTAFQLPLLNSCKNEKNESKNICCGYPCTYKGNPQTFIDSEGNKRQYMCGGTGLNDHEDLHWSVYKIIRVNKESDYSQYSAGTLKEAGDDALFEPDLKLQEEQLVGY